MTSSSQTYCTVPTVTRRAAVTILDIHGVTLEAFAKMLHPDGLPVIDNTGVKRAFDVHLEWSSDSTDQLNGSTTGIAQDPSPHTSEIYALREQLGLVLHRATAGCEFLVVDEIKRPLEN